jgi:hypothetical protein
MSAKEIKVTTRIGLHHMVLVELGVTPLRRSGARRLDRAAPLKFGFINQQIDAALLD